MATVGDSRAGDGPLEKAIAGAHPGNYKRAESWRKAMELACDVCRATSGFPTEERFGLANQIRRAAVSIPSNLAEGWGRGTEAERRQFGRLARGSACELETQLILAQELGYLSSEAAGPLQVLVDEVLRLLGAMLRQSR